MSDDGREERPTGPYKLARRLRGALADAARRPTDDAMRGISMRVLSRAEGVLDHLERAARTIEKVAKVELDIVERLVPIVEDLGELVRLNLEEARARLGRRPHRPAEPDREDDVIDVTPES